MNGTSLPFMQIADPSFYLSIWAILFYVAGGLTIGISGGLFMTGKTKHKRPHTRRGDKDRYYTREQWYWHLFLARLKLGARIIKRGA